MVVFLAKFLVTTAVTLLSVWETPSLTTPLSAHITITHFFEISTSGFPCMAASFAIKFSNSPSPFMGFAILLNLSNTSFFVALSLASILDIRFNKSFLFIIILLSLLFIYKPS